MKYLKRIDAKDNIVVVCRRIEQGDKINVEGEEMIMSSSFGLGHKMAARNIEAEEKIIKFGLPIGSATTSIAKGEHIHLHNMKSDFVPTYTLENGFF
jgi:altronate dehydratase small subunit